MTIDVFLETAVIPALRLLPPRMDTLEARAMLVAIGLQESKLRYRRQIGGPARSYLQFERGGIRGVFNHRSSGMLATVLCGSLDIPAETDAVYEAIATNDALCAGFGRLLLWTLPGPLAGPSDANSAYAQYLAAWRPGRPHQITWYDHYETAWRSVSSRPLAPTLKV